MKLFIENLFRPVIQQNMTSDLILGIPRVLCGSLLAFYFGASKFGMPWTPEKSNLQLFEVSDWFVEDVAAFGGLFAVAPLIFAWLAAATEAIGGLFLILGLNTRVTSFLMSITMLVAIFFQQWNNGLWAMLPALGFLWVALHGLIMGSGRFGIDYYIGHQLETNRLLETPINEIVFKKQKNVAKGILPVLLFLFALNVNGQYKQVAFNLNTTKGSLSPKKVVIKGNIEPLNWDDGYSMTDEDGDGIFTATIAFRTSKNYVQVKFEVDGEIELEGSDNRIVWFGEGPIKQSFMFNEFNYYEKEKIDHLRFTASQIEEDVAILKNVLEYIHPNLYRFRDSISFQDDFKNLKAQLKQNPSLTNSFGAISRFVTKIKCSHTFANLWNQNSDIQKAIIYQPDKVPFTFTRIGKRLFLDKIAFDNVEVKSGMEILGINGVKTEEVLTKLASYVSSDGNNYEKKLDRLSLTGQEKYSLFDTYFPIEFGSSSEFRLELKNLKTNKILNTSVASLSKTGRTRILKAKYGDFSTKVKDSWSFDYIGKDVAKLKMGTFAIFRDEINWKAYLDSVFIDLKEKNIKNLIVDIRGNEGGNGEIGRYLLSYALQKPLKMKAPEFSVKYLTIPNDIKEHIDTWEQTPYNFEGKIKKREDGKYYLMDKYSKARGYDFSVKKNKFEGQMFLITDSSNSSATQVLASYAKTIENVTLVGQETGGNELGINGYYIFFLRLPNTGIEVDVPVVGQYLPISENPRDGGIKPDIFVKRDPMDFIDGVDREIETILDLIN